MIQDIFPHKMHNEFRPGAVPGPDDLAMPWNGKAFLAAADFGAQSLAYPKFSDLKESPDDPVYLFTIDETGYYLLRCKADAKAEDILADPSGYAFYTL